MSKGVKSINNRSNIFLQADTKSRNHSERLNLQDASKLKYNVHRAIS